MGTDWEKQWPSTPRRQKPAKKSSGSTTGGTTVGMVLLFLGFPAVVILLVAASLAHGYHLI